MCDESLCRVLGVEAVLEKRKAEARKAKAAAEAAALETRKDDIRKAKTMDIVHAASFGRVADVQLVCQYAPEKVNDKGWTRNGNTALHWAALQNFLEIARLLLASKAAVDVLNKHGTTALHLAADKNSLEMAELLLASKAAVDVQTKNGKTPIQCAQANGHQKMVALLQQHQQ